MRAPRAALQDDRDGMLALSRSDGRLFFSGRASAEMSAALNVKYLRELSIVVRNGTYTNVHGSVPEGTLLQIAPVFLREHFQSRSPRERSGCIFEIILV
jgi:hypothetical protein